MNVIIICCTEVLLSVAQLHFWPLYKIESIIVSGPNLHRPPLLKYFFSLISVGLYVVEIAVGTIGISHE